MTNWLDKAKDITKKTKEVAESGIKKVGQAAKSEQAKKTIDTLKDQSKKLSNFVAKETGVKIPGSKPPQAPETEGPSIFDRWVKFRDNYFVKPFDEATKKTSYFGKFAYKKGTESETAEKIKSKIKEVASNVGKGTEDLLKSGAKKIVEMPGNTLRKASRRVAILFGVVVFGGMIAYGVGTQLPRSYFNYKLEALKLQKQAVEQNQVIENKKQFRE